MYNHNYDYLECGGTAPIFIHISPELPLHISERKAKRSPSITYTAIKSFFLTPHLYHIGQIYKYHNHFTKQGLPNCKNRAPSTLNLFPSDVVNGL